MLKLVLVLGGALYTLWVYHVGYDAGQAEKVKQHNASIQTITTEHGKRDYKWRRQNRGY